MEIEIKLAPVLNPQAAAVFADEQIAPHLTSLQKIRMHTRYFDNEKNPLPKGVTLRLRSENGRGVCAVKTWETEDGPRLEIEVEAETLSDGIAALLQNPNMPESLVPLLQNGEFGETCSVSFTRTVCLYKKGGLVFELCFDEGESRKGIRTGTISEMELELVSGSQKEMEQVAEYICKKYNLAVSTIGKKRQALDLDVKDTGREISPFFLSSELLNYCIKQGYVNLIFDDEKRLRYNLTQLGVETLPARFGVNFGKPCAFTQSDEE